MKAEYLKTLLTSELPRTMSKAEEAERAWMRHDEEQEASAAAGMVRLVACANALLEKGCGGPTCSEVHHTLWNCFTCTAHKLWMTAELTSISV